MPTTIKHISQWCATKLNTPIELYYSSVLTLEHKNNLKDTILFIGGVHGDEPEGVRLANDLLQYLKACETDGNLQQYRPWALIPCLNVDGFKNNERTNCNGVDLNRNFPTHDWSPEFNKPRYFPGLIPASEIETQAVVNLIETLQPSLIIHFHSWEPSIVNTGPQNLFEAQILSEVSGYKLDENIGYPTPGSLGQYGWFKKSIPVICIEEQERGDLNSIWPRFKNAFIKILNKKINE